MTLRYSLTFNGVPFVADEGIGFRPDYPSDQIWLNKPARSLERQIPLQDLMDEIDRRMPFDYLKDFSIPATWQGRNLGGLAHSNIPQQSPCPQLHVNDWWYPHGAQRFSVFRGLTLSNMVKHHVDNVGTAAGTFHFESEPLIRSTTSNH